MSAGKVAAVIVVAIVFAGCGGEGDDDLQPAASRPSATATAVSSPTPTPTPEATPAPTSAATATPSAAAEPDAGDEAGNRVPVELTLEAGAIRPRRVEVPAFLGLTLVVRNASGAERVLSIDDVVVLELLPGATERADVEGLQPGEHTLATAGGERATIVAERP